MQSRFTFIFFAVLGLAAVPVAGATDHVVLQGFVFEDLNGRVLSAPAKGQVVDIVPTLKYVGDNSTPPATVTVVVTVVDPEGEVATLRRTTTVGNETNATVTTELVWTPTEIGEYNVTVEIEGFEGTSASRTVTVAEAPLREGDLGTRLLNYPFLMLGFIGSVILFFVVLQVRKGT